MSKNGAVEKYKKVYPELYLAVKDWNVNEVERLLAKVEACGELQPWMVSNILNEVVNMYQVKYINEEEFKLVLNLRVDAGTCDAHISADEFALRCYETELVLHVGVDAQVGEVNDDFVIKVYVADLVNSPAKLLDDLLEAIQRCAESTLIKASGMGKCLVVFDEDLVVRVGEVKSIKSSNEAIIAPEKCLRKIETMKRNITDGAYQIAVEVRAAGRKSVVGLLAANVVNCQ